MSECPTCDHPRAGEIKVVEYDADGLPLAAAVRDDLGVPEFVNRAALFEVRLDGAKVDKCVGFDRPNGLVWAYKIDADGRFVQRNGELVIERRSGAVTVKRLAP